MLTQDRDKWTTVDGESQVAPNSDLDATRLLRQPRVGRESAVVRLGFFLAVVMVAALGWLVLSLVLASAGLTEAFSSEPKSFAEVADSESTGPSEAEFGATTVPASQSDSERSEPAESGEDPASGSTEPVDGEPAAAAASSTESGVDPALNGAAKSAELSQVVTVIERSIQNLEPAIGKVLVSQDFIDFLTSQQPIDPDAVQVSNCSPQYCWIWLHGDSLESRIVVARDGGGLLLMGEG